MEPNYFLHLDIQRSIWLQIQRPSEQIHQWNCQHSQQHRRTIYRQRAHLLWTLLQTTAARCFRARLHPVGTLAKHQNRTGNSTHECPSIVGMAVAKIQQRTRTPYPPTSHLKRNRVRLQTNRNHQQSQTRLHHFNWRYERPFELPRTQKS